MQADLLRREPALRDELMYEVLRSREFKPVVSYAFAGEAHIGIREAMALRTLCRRLGRRPACWDCRALSLVDALAIRAAYTRGRSASKILNSLLRTTLPYTLPTGIVTEVPWAPSVENPADDPTRHRRLRAARQLAVRALSAGCRLCWRAAGAAVCSS